MFRSHDPNTVLVSRVDSSNPLASHSKHGFVLDDAEWPSVEHYYQAMKFEDPVLREEIRTAPHPALAAKLARKRRRRVHKGWDDVKEAYMTRGPYTTLPWRCSAPVRDPSSRPASTTSTGVAAATRGA